MTAIFFSLNELVPFCNYKTNISKEDQKAANTATQRGIGVKRKTIPLGMSLYYTLFNFANEKKNKLSIHFCWVC